MWPGPVSLVTVSARVAQNGGIRPEFLQQLCRGQRRAGGSLHRAGRHHDVARPANVDRQQALRQFGETRPLLSSFSKVLPANGTSTT